MCNIQVMNYNTHVMHVINKNPEYQWDAQHDLCSLYFESNSPEI